MIKRIRKTRRPSYLVLIGFLLAGCSMSPQSLGRATNTHPTAHATRPVPAQPQIGGEPVLVVPGPARAAYIESLRQKLPWVLHPPTRVAIAGTVVAANSSGMFVNIPPVPMDPEASGTTFHPIPSEAVPGSDVRVDFVRTTDFVLAHNQQSLTPGSPILVMGINKGSTIRAVLVTDLSGMGNSGSTNVTASEMRPIGKPALLRPQAHLDASETSATTGSTSPELTGHGSAGLDGINVGLNDIGFGNKGSDCPYFRFQATVIAGFGAQWNVNLHLALDSTGSLTVISDPASGSALSLNGTVNHTYYSAFGGSIQWGVKLGCDTSIPLPQVSLFGQTYGGGHVGLDFDYGKTWSMLLENETDQSVPLWGDHVLNVPGLSCISELSSDNIPEIGQLLAEIHGPAITVPICAGINLEPAGFRASVHIANSQATQGIVLGDHTTSDHPSATVESVSAPTTVTVDTYNFAPKQDVSITAGIELGRPAPQKQSKSSTSGGNHYPLATAICNDGYISYAQHSQGQCGGSTGGHGSGGHGGIKTKLDPSSSSSNSDASPDSSWTDLANGHITFGPWNVPFLSGSTLLTGMIWNPTSVQFGSSENPNTCTSDQLTAAVTSYITQTTTYAPSEYTIANVKTVGSNPAWASFELVATAAGAATFQQGTGVAECTSGWQVKDIGGVEVGCTTVPKELWSTLGLQCPTGNTGSGSSVPGAGSMNSPGSTGSSDATGSSGSGPAIGPCSAINYQDPTGDASCAAFGTPLSSSGHTVTASAMSASTGSDGSSLLCATVTDSNTGAPPFLESSADWVLEPAPPGGVGAGREPVDSTINDQPIIQVGQSVTGQVCFTDPQAQQVWLRWDPAGFAFVWS